MCEGPEVRVEDDTARQAEQGERQGQAGRGGAGSCRAYQGMKGFGIYLVAKKAMKGS